MEYIRHIELMFSGPIRDIQLRRQGMIRECESRCVQQCEGPNSSSSTVAVKAAPGSAGYPASAVGTAGDLSNICDLPGTNVTRHIKVRRKEVEVLSPNINGNQVLG